MSAWQPLKYIRYEGCVESSTGVAIILTDAGKAYLKPLGNNEGPHALAREFVGTSLAHWFGLKTLDFSIIQIAAGYCAEIELGNRKVAEPGSAFVTRATNGLQWEGYKDELEALDNPEDISRLVVFDSWIRNYDRYSPDKNRKPNYGNVFLSKENTETGKLILLAIDHTHCFMQGGEMNKEIAHIDAYRDDNVYGLFPEFAPYMRRDVVLESLNKLSEVDKAMADSIIEKIPQDWEVSAEVRGAWGNFVRDRAHYLTGTLIKRLEANLGPRLFF
ncbi:MAG: hypothetical protein NUW37_16140 [Planctomycetes bacterium]|nr:hypothetical protein [Planctomycetota bacterium]